MLSPYHSMLNMNELMWSILKGHIARNNTEQAMNRMSTWLVNMIALNQLAMSLIDYKAQNLKVVMKEF